MESAVDTTEYASNPIPNYNGENAYLHEYLVDSARVYLSQYIKMDAEEAENITNPLIFNYRQET